jgi:hypothetical protein
MAHLIDAERWTSASPSPLHACAKANCRSSISISFIQTVHAKTNPRYHALISRFEQLTGCPVLVNTSFNVRGEPIVCTPEDAFACFMGTGIEFLAVGNCIQRKEQQNPILRRIIRLPLIQTDVAAA